VSPTANSTRPPPAPRSSQCSEWKPHQSGNLADKIPCSSIHAERVVHDDQRISLFHRSWQGNRDANRKRPLTAILPQEPDSLRLSTSVQKFANVFEQTLPYGRGFHEKAWSCQAIPLIFLSGDSQGGGALLWGEPRFLRRGGNPPAPAFPGGETGKGSSIPCCRRQFSFFRSASSSDPSSLPYWLFGSAHSRVCSAYLNRRHALLPFALFLELSFRCQLVSSIF
jgi:hypothetical protein